MSAKIKLKLRRSINSEGVLSPASSSRQSKLGEMDERAEEVRSFKTDCRRQMPEKVEAKQLKRLEDASGFG
jgi:hypothetical protein